MQAIGSLATLVQIVVASSHVQALGARRSPQSATVSLDNRSHLPYLQIMDYNTGCYSLSPCSSHLQHLQVPDQDLTT